MLSLLKVLLMFSTQIYGPILAILTVDSLFHLETVTNRTAYPADHARYGGRG